MSAGRDPPPLECGECNGTTAGRCGHCCLPHELCIPQKALELVRTQLSTVAGQVELRVPTTAGVPRFGEVHVHLLEWNVDAASPPGSPLGSPPQVTVKRQAKKTPLLAIRADFPARPGGCKIPQWSVRDGQNPGRASPSEAFSTPVRGGCGRAALEKMGLYVAGEITRAAQR